MGDIISIREMQDIECGILRYFREVCERNGLRYYLAYGTLLGAVRHSGFIPWDDDIDVMMPRPDYLKLVDIWSKQGHSNYELICMHNNKNYFAPLAKIFDSRTVLVQDYGQVEKTELGVYIDVFIVDGLPSDPRKCDRLFERQHKLRFYWGLSVRMFNSKSRSLPVGIAKTLVSIPFRLMGFRYFLNKLDRLCSTYDFDTSEYVGVLCFGVGAKGKLQRSQLENPSQVVFEGDEYNAPQDFDTYLTGIYGDYMKLPPREERVSHHRYTVYWK